MSRIHFMRSPASYGSLHGRLAGENLSHALQVPSCACCVNDSATRNSQSNYGSSTQVSTRNGASHKGRLTLRFPPPSSANYLRVKSPPENSIPHMSRAAHSDLQPVAHNMFYYVGMPYTIDCEYAVMPGWLACT